ncbi:MAG: aldo/keto reductase [Planctomycetota bacterium]
MRTTTLGKTGLEVSAVGFGGIPIQRVSDGEAVRCIHRAMEVGVTFIDTAAGYGDSEHKIGLAIEGRRDGLVLATKSAKRTGEEIRKQLDQSLRSMRTDFVDLFQFHMVNDREVWGKIKKDGALDVVLEAREKGQVRHIGVTCHHLEGAIDLVEEPLFETLQFPFNLVTREPADLLIHKVRGLNLGFIVMKPLCGGQYTDANLAFKFLNGFPDLVPIPGIEKPEEIEEIAGIVASGAILEGAELERAEKIAADLGKLFCRRCGYCMPCPEGIPVQTCMIFESFVKRTTLEDIRNGVGRTILEKAPECTECRECEEKCPYDLPTTETVKQSLALARKVLGAPQTG